MQSKQKQSRWWEESEEREMGNCMPLTITFPVFFYAHTLGKAFREISPAHTVLHKQRQEDWEKEHNHQHGTLKQEMATGSCEEQATLPPTPESKYPDLSHLECEAISCATHYYE